MLSHEEHDGLYPKDYVTQSTNSPKGTLLDMSSHEFELRRTKYHVLSNIFDFLKIWFLSNANKIISRRSLGLINLFTKIKEILIAGSILSKYLMGSY